MEQDDTTNLRLFVGRLLGLVVAWAAILGLIFLCCVMSACRTQKSEDLASSGHSASQEAEAGASSDSATVALLSRLQAETVMDDVEIRLPAPQRVVLPGGSPGGEWPEEAKQPPNAAIIKIARIGRRTDAVTGASAAAASRSASLRASSSEDQTAVSASREASGGTAETGPLTWLLVVVAMAVAGWVVFTANRD